MKDITLKEFVAGLKNGEAAAFVANNNLGITDVYVGQLENCSHHYGDGSKTFSMKLGVVTLATAISQKSLKDELATFNLNELAGKAIIAQKKMANQTPEEVAAWAKKLAKDSVAAGESEYGSGNDWISDVMSPNQVTLTKEAMEEGMAALMGWKSKPSHPGVYASGEKLYGGAAMGKLIAEDIDHKARLEALNKISDLEKKLSKINPKHPMATKIQGELLAMKTKLQAMLHNPVQVVPSVSAYGEAPLAQPDWISPAQAAQEFIYKKTMPALKDLDAANFIKDAFEKADIAVVKVKAAGNSAVATIVFEKGQGFSTTTLNETLSAVGWSRTGHFIEVEANTNGSKVYQVDLVKKIQPSEIAKAPGAVSSYPYKIENPATLYATAGTATIGPVTVGVDFGKPNSEFTGLAIHASPSKAIILKPDGQVEIPEGMTLDEASQKFWDAIATSNPMRAEVYVLTQKYMELTTAYQDVLKRLHRYEGDPKNPAPEDPRAARFGNIARNI